MPWVLQEDKDPESRCIHLLVNLYKPRSSKQIQVVNCKEQTRGTFSHLIENHV